MREYFKPVTLSMRIVLLVLALVLPQARAAAALADCIDATCRVSTPQGAVGTGCVFDRSGGSVLVLTNAHVVGSQYQVGCQFWRDGHPSGVLPGRVVLASQAADMAVIWLPETAFEGAVPRAVPLAGRDELAQPGQTVLSVGCSRGTWPTAWKGLALGYRDGDLRFMPPPAEGRSGSAIFDEQGERILGLVRARDDQRGEGIATPVQALYPALAGTPSSEGCQDGICPTVPYRFLPYRQRQEYERRAPQAPAEPAPAIPAPAWPTLPGPVRPDLDLSETNRKLDEIARLLKSIKDERGSQEGVPPVSPVLPPPAAPAKPSPDPRSEERLKVVEQSAEAAQKQAGKLQEGVTLLQDVVQRFETRLEKVRSEGAQTAGETAKAYTRDFLGEKLSDGTLGLTVGKILTGALGLSGPLALGLTVGMWFLSRRAGRRLRQPTTEAKP